MRSLQKFIIAIFITLIPSMLSMTVACTNLRSPITSKKFTEISFGKTGGFTNIPVEYRMDSKGNVFRIKSNDTVKINSVPKSMIKKINKSFSEMDFEHFEMLEPGNITYFITFISARYRNTVKWNDNTGNDKIKDLYKELLKTVNP